MIHLKVFNYFILIFLVLSSLQVFSASICEEEGFSGLKHSGSHKQKAIGIESYRQLLVRLAQSSLGVTRLTPQQVKVLETYYDVVRGEEGEDGTFVRVGQYTFSQRRRVVRYLREVFSSEQVTTLIETGIVEINRVDPKEIENGKARRDLHKKKWYYLVVEGKHDEQIHQGRARLLEETDNVILLEVEKIDTESGQIFKEHWYFSKGTNYQRFNSVSKFNKIEIQKRTNNGFVIRERSGSEAFFSFKKAIENGLLPKEPTVQDYKELEDILNNFFSGQWDQIPALKEAFQEGVLDKDHSAYKKFIALLDKSVIEDSEYYLKDVEVTLNPEMEAVYSAVQSTRKKIGIDDLNLPVPTDRESQLAKQGYRASYIGGMDLVNQWVALRRQLQELEANPYTTHIEYFADQVPLHIAYIKKGLKENYSPENESYGSKLSQLWKLKELEREAGEVIYREGVTYKWWLEFNHKLTEVMSGAHEPKVDGEAQRLMKETMSYFPLKVVIPTIEPDIGIITFNRANLEGVYPAGVINRQTIEADGAIYSSFVFLLHDHFHAALDGNQAYREYSIGHRLFHKRLLYNIENLPPGKRKKVEAVYFIMTHEYEEIGNINISYSDRTLETMRVKVIETIRQSNDVGVFKFPDDPGEKNKKLEDLADIFMEVYIQSLQHQ